MTGSASQAIGKLSLSSGAQSMSLGYDASSSGLRSYAFGYGAIANATDSVAIGRSVSTTASNQVALGGSTQTVRISEAYTLPTTDGTNGQVLTTDGSGAVTFADAGGGGGDPDLYRDNAVSATTPTASGANAIAIGDNTTASGEDAVAIGDNIVASGLRSISLGGFSDATGDYSVALGAGAQALGEKAVAIIGNANYQRTTAIGMNGGGGKSIAGVSNTNTGGATALGGSYAGALDSFAAAISNNTSTYGATGAGSVAIGYQAKSTNTYSVNIGAQGYATGSTSLALGYRARATGTGGVSIGTGGYSTSSGTAAVVIGYDVDASGTNAFSLGREITNSMEQSHVSGWRVKNDITKGKRVYGSGRFADSGDAQTGTFVLRSDTTDATAEALTTDNSAGSTDDQIILPNNSAYSFSGTIIARESAAAGSDYASWEIKGALLRDANAASTVLGNGIKNKLYASAGASAWDIALTADTTNGGLKIEVTGAAATNIRWVATVNTSEVTYA